MAQQHIGLRLKHGQQALHLAGHGWQKPAFFAEEDDVIENIDNDTLALNSDFVMGSTQAYLATKSDIRPRSSADRASVS